MGQLFKQCCSATTQLVLCGLIDDHENLPVGD